ncbi:DUF2971 domain-containing protein [Mucilaginibacter sp. PAMB04274]|uniref:DUF2971 domain-containing protein n=1 Tax=Mucilaginibacter sp. PAMB04274 TaxID=3138568 RepID=UPI0031F64FAE
MAGIKILENCTIRVTPPNQFNDPFEFASYGTGIIDRGHIISLIEDEQLLLERYKLIAKDSGMSLEQYREDQATLLSDNGRLQQEIATATQLYMEWAAHFVDQVSHNAGVVCLTEDDTSILMWSHYASNHEGLMIGLDVDRLPYLKLFNVEYTTEHQLPIDLSRVHLMEYLQEQYVAIMRRKFSVWGYEKEYRMQFHFSVCEQIPAIGMWFYRFDPEVVRSVTIGMKCKIEDREHVLSLLAEPRFAHVQVKEAVKDKTEYQVRYKEVRPASAI